MFMQPAPVVPVCSVTTILFHENPHPEELMAALLLEKLGEPYFPGISTAQWQCIDKTIKGTTAEQLESEGTLCLGVQGGRFDEHHRNAMAPGAPRESCLSLVAKFLGVDQTPALKSILHQLHIEDTQGGGGKMSFGNLLKGMWDHYGKNSPSVIEWAMMPLEVMWANAQRQAEAPAELKKVGAWYDFVGRNETVKVVVLEPTDNENVHKLALGKIMGGMLAVKLNESGNVQIFPGRQTLPYLGEYMRDLAKAIRIAEAMARNPGVEYNLSHAEWHQEGEVSISPNWCLTVDGLLLNGSKTHSGVEPTVLTTGQILDAITAVTDIAFGGPVKVSLGSPKQIDRAVDRSERKRLANDNTPLAGQFASSSVLGGFQAAA
jgi:hypothetical protein